MINQYCVGFAFSQDTKHVALIRKNRPEWQRDLYNGLGGKLVHGVTNPKTMESPREAMAREYLEEGGVQFAVTDWQQFASISGDGYILYALRLFDDRMYGTHTMTDEGVILVPVPELLCGRVDLPLVHNLPYLLHMAVHKDIDYAHIREHPFT